MVDMNTSGLWGQGFRCYEHFRIVDDMNDFGLWVQTSKYYEKLRALVDMKDFGCELWVVNHMKGSM